MGTLEHGWWGWKMGQPLWETGWWDLKHFKIESCDPASAPVVISSSRDLKRCLHTPVHSSITTAEKHGLQQMPGLGKRGPAMPGNSTQH